MGNVSKIKVGNTWHQVKDAEARTQNAAHHTYYVAGTQTAATNLWTGNLPDVEALYEGLAIDYWLPFAGTGTAATLTLTLKGGNTVTADVYQTGTTRVTTHFAANSLMHFVYQTVTISNVERTGWWAVKPQDANTTDIVNLQEGSAAYQADSAVYRYQLLFQTDENRLTPLNNVNNVTANTKTMLTSVDFDPFGKIYYYNSMTNIAAGSNMTTALYYHRNAVDLRYTFNCAQTLTAHRDLYLKVVPQSNGMVRIAADPCWTQSLPSTNDGYWYIYLGRTYSTYQFVLHTEHPVYYHDGTELKQASPYPGASPYVLPIASSSKLGGVKVGTTLSIAASTGVLSIASSVTSQISSATSKANSASTTANQALDRVQSLEEGIASRPDYTISTVDLEDGISALDAGKLYFYYEV